MKLSIKVILISSLIMISSCSLISSNNSTKKSNNDFLLTNEKINESDLIKNESYIEYKIPVESVLKLIESDSNYYIKDIALKNKITPKKIEEIRNFLIAYKNYLGSKEKWEKFLNEININGFIKIKVDVEIKKKEKNNSYFSLSNKNKENLDDLLESEIYQQKDISNILEEIFYEKDLGYIKFNNVDSFFPQNGNYDINYSVTKDIINGSEVISPHIIANELLKIKDKSYFISFMNYLNIDSNKINRVLEKQKIIDNHNELYYQNNTESYMYNIPIIIDPDTGAAITPEKIRSILSNGDIIVIKPKKDWTEFFYFWQHAGLFDAEKYDNTKNFFFNGKDSFDIKSVITSNQIKFETASVQGSGYEALSTYVQARILKILSPITDSRTIIKTMNFARNRYVDNNFGYMVPLISSNLFGDSFNLEEVYRKTYCSLVIDRVYRLANLNVSRSYEVSGIITPGDLNAAAYNFYISYSILGILPNILPKRLIKPTLKEKFIGYNSDVTDIIEKKKANQSFHGKSCNITNFWCTGN